MLNIFFKKYLKAKEVPSFVLQIKQALIIYLQILSSFNLCHHITPLVIISQWPMCFWLSRGFC